MKPQITRIGFFSGYGGKVYCSIWIDDIEHKLEIEQIENNLLKQINKKGYTIEKTARMKYPHIIINK